MILFAIVFVGTLVLTIVFSEIRLRAQDKKSKHALKTYHRYVQFSGVLLKLDLMQAITYYSVMSNAGWKYLK